MPKSNDGKSKRAGKLHRERVSGCKPFRETICRSSPQSWLLSAYAQTWVDSPGLSPLPDKPSGTQHICVSHFMSGGLTLLIKLQGQNYSIRSSGWMRIEINALNSKWVVPRRLLTN